MNKTLKLEVIAESDCYYLLSWIKIFSFFWWVLKVYYSKVEYWSRKLLQKPFGQCMTYLCFALTLNQKYGKIKVM